MTNPFVFHEIVTPSPYDLSHFYGEVFGWQFQRIDDQGTLYAIRSSTPGCAPVGLLTKTSDEPQRRSDKDRLTDPSDERQSEICL